MTTGFVSKIKRAVGASVIAGSMLTSIAAAQTLPSDEAMAEIVSFIAQEEGYRPCAYDDFYPEKVLEHGDTVHGTLTVGYGQTGADVAIGTCVSEDEARAWLENEVSLIVTKLAPIVRDGAPTEEWVAWTSFAYNVGVSATKTSTAMKRHQTGDTAGAAEAMQWWNKSKGKVLNGLVDRREREANMLLAAYSTTAK